MVDEPLKVKILKISERSTENVRVVQFQGMPDLWFALCDMGSCGTCGGDLFHYCVKEGKPIIHTLRCVECLPLKKQERVVQLFRMPPDWRLIR